MRIAFVGSADPFLGVYPPGGGIETQVWGIARSLSAKGHDVHILARYRGYDRRVVSGVTIHGVRAVLPDRIASYFIFSANALRELEEISPDAIYLAERFTSLFPSMLPVPKVFVTHNKEAFDFYLEFARSNPLRMGLTLFKRRVEDRVIRNSNFVCAPTAALADLLRKRGYGHVGVLPNAVDPSEFTCGPEGDYILYSGWLNEIKGVQYLIKAFSSVSADFPAVRLVISGEGPFRSRLESLAKESVAASKIEFREWSAREDYLDLLSNCMFFVLPSLTETFGVVLLDAMASCKPVVASNIIGPSGIVTDGDSGLLSPPGDAPALASKLRLLLSDEGGRRAMGARARKRVEGEFNINRVADILEQMLTTPSQRGPAA